ncbi:MAG: hypothetical protein U0Q15_12940 [Kineosporiaceae bacterium]
MKSAFLLSSESNLFRLVADVLKADPSCSTRDVEGVVQLVDSEGRLLTVFAHVDEESAWEFRDGPFVLADESTHVDTSAMTACVVECRWADLFVDVVGRLADQVPNPLWVLDADGVIWPAAEVDPSRVRL